MPSASPEKIEDEGLRLAVTKLGSFNALAKELGMSPQAIMEWKRIPSHRILQIEKVTGIDRAKLRPDLYARHSKREK